MEVFEKIQGIIDDHFGFGAEAVTAKTALRGDLNLDSLDDVELEMAIEEEFDICVPTGASDDWLMVSDIEKFVNKAIIDREMQGAE